jgi:hypothetical protein
MPWYYSILRKLGMEKLPNYWQISVTQQTKFNIKNQYTSKWAPLVQVVACEVA